MLHGMTSSQRTIRLWLVLASTLGGVGCSSNSEVSLREIERAPATYKGRLVTVRACYHNGPESTLVQPCEGPRRDEVAWFVSRAQLENAAKAVPGFVTGPLKYERPSPDEEALDQQLSRLPNGVVVEVLLRAEFEASLEPLYGPAPGYYYQLVVHRVLKVTPSAPPR